MTEVHSENYLKFRGKCKELSEAACVDDPSLTLVRGHYQCPFWGKQAHWWTVRLDGSIYDPTVLQFPFGNLAQPEYYIPFNGVVECSNCSKEITEDEAVFDSNYVFCCTQCLMHFVGVG